MAALKRGVAALSLTLAGFSWSPAGEASERLVLTGSSTVAPLAAEIAKRFEQSHPGLRIDVQTGGSGRGITDLRQGLSDIGLVSRALKPDESDLTAHTIAMDGIAMIVHSSNPAVSLTDDQIRSVYTGKIRNWNELGKGDGGITVVSKAEGRSTLEAFLAYFRLSVTEIKAQVVIGDNQQGIKTVAGNPGAIGYVSIGAAETDIKDGVPVRMLPVNGVNPTLASVADASFPITRQLNLVVKGPPKPVVAEFVAFARSEAVRDLIEGLCFVPPRRPPAH